jgi:O-antigen/teichoic acid export membrane protein
MCRGPPVRVLCGGRDDADRTPKIANPPHRVAGSEGDPIIHCLQSASSNLAPSPILGTPPPRASLRRLGSQFAVILSGELVQSLFHFVLNVLLARRLSAHDYGVFAIVFTVGAVGITYIRALVAVPVTLHVTHSRGRPAARAYEVMFGTGSVLVSALIALSVGLTLVPVIGLGALAGGAFVGLYAFRSYLRIALLAQGRTQVASLGDLVYALGGLAFLVILLNGEAVALLDRAFTAIAAAHGFAIVVTLAALHQRPRLSFNKRMRGRYRMIWRTLVWSLAGVTSLTVQGQGLTLLLAFLIGPAAYAPIAATLVLYTPLRIATIALTNMLLPDLSGLLASRQIARAHQIVVRSVALNGSLCAVYGALMLIALPPIEDVLFRGRFDDEPMGWIGIAIWSSVTLAQLYGIPRAFLEASGAYSTITQIAVASAGFGFVIMVPALKLLPPACALIGLAASEAMTLVLSVQAVRAFIDDGAETTQT